ncbi:MAG: Crp/Fnr family transcriptional regulator [Cytophagaceae bacterium]
MKAPDCFNCHCRDCTILKRCSKEWLEIIDKEKNFIRCKKGQLIIPEGIPMSQFYFIYQGKVKITSVGLYGKQQIKRLAKEGDIIGFRGLASNNIFSASVYALEDSALCSINKDLFLDLLQANPELMFESLKLVTSELVRMERRMKNLTTLNVREKVAESLLYVNEVFGNPATGELEVCLSRQELAEIAMTTKEQVSKCLSEFEQEGKIRTEGKKLFLLQPDALQKMTCD